MSEAALTSLSQALAPFAEARLTQSQAHIRGLHQHIAQRLVIEGGFQPDDITPRPPLRVEIRGAGRRRTHRLLYDATAAGSGEQIVLGGLKTKLVDVVVSQKHLGPCLAVSVKGTLNAFRNLTNRMEEAVGDCTNLHIAYPALVYGFLHFIRANLEADVQSRNDIAIYASGRLSDEIGRYHDVMGRLTGRRDLRDDVSRYEAVALALVDTDTTHGGRLRSDFPTADSPLAFERFFLKLYDAYDLRFVYAAPALQMQTRRVEWDPESPAIETAIAAGFQPRLA